MKRGLLIILLLLVTSFAAEDAIRIQNQKTFPAALQAGDREVVLQFDLYHTGKITYTNITVELNFPQQFEAIKDSYFVDRLLPGQSATVSFRFNTKSSVDPGTYTIPMAIKYTEASGPYDTTSSRELYLSVSSTPTLKLADLAFSPKPHIGQPFEVVFTLNNTGALPASNILASISVASGAGVTWIPEYQVVDYIAPASMGNITFKGIVSTQTVPGAYAGAITLAYSGKTLTNSFILEASGTPDLKLAGSQTDKTPYAGEAFTLSAQFEDIGKARARSVVVALNDPKIEGTQISYIGTIEPDDTGSAIFDITIRESGSYAIPMRISYVDDDGNEYMAEETITMFIYTKPTDFSWLVLLVILGGVAWYWKNRNKRKTHIAKIVD